MRKIRINTILISLVFLLNTAYAAAQAPPTSFLVADGNTDYDSGRGIGSDDNGNVYVTGGFQISVTFGSTTLYSSGGRDMFLVKYDSAGIVQWAVSAGGSSASERGRAIAVDGAGNSYVAGYFYNSATFGSITLTSNGGYDIYIAKYNTSGVVQWVKSAGGSSDDDDTYGVSVNTYGDCYICGNFGGTATFGTGVSVISAGGLDAYLAKYNSAGVLQWVNRMGGSGNDIAFACASDQSGNVGVTGYFNGTASFDATTNLTSSGYADIFIAKYTSASTLMFAEKAGGSNWEEERGMNTDNLGNFYITGNYVGTATFGSGPGSTSITSVTALFSQPPVPSQDIFTAKYDASGNFEWVESAGGGRDEGGRGVALDDYGNVNIVGYFEGDIYFGTFLLINNAPGPNFAYEDPFAAQYSTSGTFKWAVHGGTGWHDSGYGIGTDPWGNVLVTGSIIEDGSGAHWNGTPFPGTSYNNNDDIFVVKMGYASGPPPLTVSFTQTNVSCYGGSDGAIDMSVIGGAPLYNYLWSTNATTEDISGLIAGTYTVTVTDAAAIIVDSVVITQPAAAISGEVFSTAETGAFNDGMAWVVVSGGTPAYTYSWDDPAYQTTDTAYYLSAGIYKVVFADLNGCNDSLTIQVADS
ncbi:MAG: hypothetical protein K8S00_12710, partial [Bacteroidales bacterium]|nr:hypothetical protein [Bacteroidales bacterium]